MSSHNFGRLSGHSTPKTIELWIFDEKAMIVLRWEHMETSQHKAIRCPKGPCNLGHEQGDDHLERQGRAHLNKHDD